MKNKVKVTISCWFCFVFDIKFLKLHLMFINICCIDTTKYFDFFFLNPYYWYLIFTWQTIFVMIGQNNIKIMHVSKSYTNYMSNPTNLRANIVFCPCGFLWCSTDNSDNWVTAISAVRLSVPFDFYIFIHSLTIQLCSWPFCWFNYKPTSCNVIHVNVGN